MRLALLLVLTLSTAPALAGAACLTGGQARVGRLEVVRHQMLNGEWQPFFLLRLPRRSCVVDAEGAQHPDQSEIGLFPRAGKQMARMVGRKVRVDGDGPIVGDTQWHIRDLTFMAATAVPLK